MATIGPHLQALFTSIRKGLVWHQGLVEHFGRLQANSKHLEGFFSPTVSIHPPEAYNARIEAIVKDLSFAAFVRLSPEDRALFYEINQDEILSSSRLLYLAENKIPESWEESNIHNGDYWPHQIDQKKATLIWRIFSFLDKIPDDTTRDHFLSAMELIGKNKHAVLIGVEESGTIFVEERWGDNLRGS